jgi:hypothetical protein
MDFGWVKKWNGDEEQRIGKSIENACATRK